MARVLVTGATGFIGNHLVKLLSQGGHDVTCLVRSTSKINRLNNYEPRFCYGDVRQADTINRAVVNQDLVFHLAGLTKSFRTQDLYDVNARGTENVARGKRQNNRQRREMQKNNRRTFRILYFCIRENYFYCGASRVGCDGKESHRKSTKRIHSCKRL